MKEFIDDVEFTETAGLSMPSHYNRFSSSLMEIIPNEFNFETFKSSSTKSSDQINFNANMSHICSQNTCTSEMATQLKQQTSAQANYIKSTANNLRWKQLAHNDNRHLTDIESFNYNSIEQSQRIDSLFRDLLKR